LVVAGDVTRLPAVFARLHDHDRAPLPVVLCCDVEPDLRTFKRGVAGRWTAFEELLPRIQALRERVANLTGVAASFSWFLRMDPQVADTWGSPGWVAEQYATAFADLESHGDQLGLHTHTWRWHAGAGGWVRDQDPAWEEHCVDVALRAFETAYGQSCLAHRGGDRYLSGGMLRRLEANGVAVDLTVEPDKPPEGALAKHEMVTGLTPDYRGVPRTPYRSTPDAFPAADPTSRSGPLLIPLASGPRGKHRHAKPLHPFMIPSIFAPGLLRATHNSSPPVLAFAMRTEPAVISIWDVVKRNLEHLARMPGARFVTAGVAAAALSGLV
jgi:hypothetical protein